MPWIFIIICYLYIALLVVVWAKTVDVPLKSYSPVEDWLDAILIGLAWPLYAAYFLLVLACRFIRFVFGIDPDD